MYNTYEVITNTGFLKTLLVTIGIGIPVKNRRLSEAEKRFYLSQRGEVGHPTRTISISVPLNHPSFLRNRFKSIRDRLKTMGAKAEAYCTTHGTDNDDIYRIEKSEKLE